MKLVHDMETDLTTSVPSVVNNRQNIYSYMILSELETSHILGK